MRGEIEVLILFFFCSLKCFICRCVGGGGVDQKFYQNWSFCQSFDCRVWLTPIILIDKNYYVIEKPFPSYSFKVVKQIYLLKIVIRTFAIGKFREIMWISF